MVKAVDTAAAAAAALGLAFEMELEMWRGRWDVSFCRFGENGRANLEWVFLGDLIARI